MNIGAAAFREDRVPPHPHNLDQEMNGNLLRPRGKGSPVGRTYGLAAQRQSRRRPDCACGEGVSKKVEAHLTRSLSPGRIYARVPVIPTIGAKHSPNWKIISVRGESNYPPTI